MEIRNFYEFTTYLDNNGGFDAIESAINIIISDDYFDEYKHYLLKKDLRTTEDNQWIVIMFTKLLDRPILEPLTTLGIIALFLKMVDYELRIFHLHMEDTNFSRYQFEIIYLLADGDEIMQSMKNNGINPELKNNILSIYHKIQNKQLKNYTQSIINRLNKLEQQYSTNTNVKINEIIKI